MTLCEFDKNLPGGSSDFLTVSRPQPHQKKQKHYDLCKFGQKYFNITSSFEENVSYQAQVP